MAGDGKFGCGGKRGTHSELMDLCNEAVLTLRASFESQQLPALSVSVHVDGSDHRVSS